MKPKTKKTLIIMLAIAVIGVIVWLLFFRKKEWEKEIDRLNIADSYKEQLRKGVKQVLSDPTYSEKDMEQEAAKNGLTLAQWLVIEAAFELGWTAGITSGQLDIRPKN